MNDDKLKTGAQQNGGKLTTFAQLRTAVIAVARYAAQIGKTAAGAIEEVAAGKADKPLELAHTIQAGGWVNQSNGSNVTEDPEEGNTWARYPWYYDFAVESLTAEQRADAEIQADSLHSAKLCGFSQTVKTRAGYIRVRAQKQPEGDIRVLFKIT